MSDQVKILFLGQPASANTISWLEGLRELGCQVELATVRPSANYPAHVLGNPRFPPRLRFLTSAGELSRLIRNLRPDLLLAYRVTSYGYLAARTGFKPVVMAVQNEQITYLDYPSYWRRRALEHFARYAIKRADLFHAWSENIRQGLLKFGADESKILVLHRGVNMNLFHPAPEPRPPSAAGPIFISTRSLTHEYLIDRLLRAFLLLLRDLPAARLRILGDGEDRPHLEALARDLELTDKVVFTGRLDGAATAAELRRADVYVSLIDTEGLSSSLIEAGAVGVVPVVADMPASRELVEDGKTGFLLRDCSPMQVAETMKKAAADATVRENCFRHTAKVKARFDRHRNLEVFIRKYRELLGPGASGRQCS